MIKRDEALETYRRAREAVRVTREGLTRAYNEHQRVQTEHERAKAQFNEAALALAALVSSESGELALPAVSSA